MGMMGYLRCGSGLCVNVTAEVIEGVGLCDEHWDAVAYALRQRVPATVDAPRAMILYVLVDKGVHIFRTSHPAARLSRMEREHAPSTVELIAAEPGGKERERGVRRRLADMAMGAGDRVFTPRKPVIDVVKAVRAKHPQWASQVDAMARGRNAPSIVERYVKR